jgi:hypothetical protein
MPAYKPWCVRLVYREIQISSAQGKVYELQVLRILAAERVALAEFQGELNFRLSNSQKRSIIRPLFPVSSSRMMEVTSVSELGREIHPNERIAILIATSNRPVLASFRSFSYKLEYHQ